MSSPALVPTTVEDGAVLPQTQRPSLLHGPTDPPLVDLTLGELLNLQCLHHGTQEALVIPWTGARWTYNELNHQSQLMARALLKLGIRVGDRVGIMAGNCEQYGSLFFAATRIGAILVILNNTYTPTEAQYALEFSGMLFRPQAMAITDHSQAHTFQTARFFSPPRRSAALTKGHCSPNSR